MAPRTNPTTSPQKPCAASPQIFQEHLRACAQLRSSQTFEDALLIVLAAGNFLNYGTRSGAAAGFRLNTLTKIFDTRSCDGKFNILQVGSGLSIP